MNKRFNMVGLDTTDGALTQQKLKKEDEQLVSECESLDYHNYLITFYHV